MVSYVKIKEPLNITFFESIGYCILSKQKDYVLIFIN